MTYKINGKYYELNNKDLKEIKSNMKEFNISESDAVRMFFEDWEYIKPEDKTKIEKVPDIKTKKEYAKSDKPRNNKPRERKIDETKKILLSAIHDCLVDGGAVVSEIKTETEIAFSFNGENYTVKLTKHRAKKGE